MPKKKIVEEEIQEAVDELEREENAEQKTVSAVFPDNPAKENIAADSGEVLLEGGESSPLGEKSSSAEELALAAEETHQSQTVPVIPVMGNDVPQVETANPDDEIPQEMPDIMGSEALISSDTELITSEDYNKQTASPDNRDNEVLRGGFGAGEKATGAGLEKLPSEQEKPDDEEAASGVREPVADMEERTSDSERRAFYDLDFHELDRDLTPEQRQEWNSIYASYRGRNAMSGTVVGVDQHRLRVRDRKTGEMTWQRLYCAIVIPFRVRILIPETEVWMKGEERPGFVLRNLPGAKIDFVIIHVDREAGFAVGSRRLAMPSRRYYFSTQPGMNEPGSRVNCEVLVVGPRRCLVSCHGYDLDLTQRELSYTAVPDLREAYHSGQTLGCIVKAYDREKNRLTISVKETAPNPFDGAVFRHPVQSHRQGVIAGKYGGGVFCNLPDGVTVMCNYSFHYDDSAFRTGDRVMLIIQRYDNTRKQIYGKIVAKC